MLKRSLSSRWKKLKLKLLELFSLNALLFEQYGGIRTLYTACKHRGFVMISYYDIRAARNAMKALQNKPLRRRRLDIHYSIPKGKPPDWQDFVGIITLLLINSTISFIEENNAGNAAAALMARLAPKAKPRPLQALSGQICQICGDDVGLTADGELFVACNECAFPTCRICYEYERQEGNQVCPQCKTRFKRLKGCARVSGDEEEDGVDDLENEFNFMGKDKQDNQLESMLQGHMSYGRRAYGRN